MAVAEILKRRTAVQATLTELLGIGPEAGLTTTVHVPPQTGSRIEVRVPFRVAFRTAPRTVPGTVPKAIPEAWSTVGVTT
ncbi:MAG TPA: hypothetical protein VMH22_14745 [bacterium]|nr:hypothetical protein [bacterium]